ncbi:hypothetical protein [Nocardioides sp.]|uniref:hypothetical protein n=1 Tax=Nocardioides sp. TaxID=35761 RepID=UPI002626D7EA|nr:hypothetical protein [Nocardioides sp.]
MDAVGLTLALGGISDAATLCANVGRSGLRRAVRAGELVHVGRDRYALPVTDAALALAREANGYLILESAALHWGWEDRLAPDSPQVAVPRNRRPPPGVVRRDLPQAVVEGWANGTFHA